MASRLRERPRLQLLAVIVVSLSAGRAFPVDPALHLSQYIHSSYKRSEAGDLAVTALAQTADGYLWIGTDDGLVRYDGFRFMPWKPAHGEQLPSQRVTAMRASAAGGLWIGTFAGLCRLERGHLTNWRQREGLPAGAVMAILEDHSGTVWVGTAGSQAGGLASIQQGSVKLYGIAVGLPNSSVLSLFEDDRYHLWVGTANGFCRWQHGGVDSCQLTESGAEILSMAQDSGGRLCIVDAKRGVLRVSSGKPGTMVRVPRDGVVAAKTLVADRDGNLWIGTVGQGLFCLHNGQLEHFSQREGLSNDLVESVLEDRDGNLWVGTAGGLDQFREPKVKVWSTPEGLSGNLITAVYASRDGDVWVGTVGGGLNRLHNGKFSSYFHNSGLKKTTVISLNEDEAGRLWVGTTHGLGYISRGRFVEVCLADGTRLDRAFAIAEGSSGILWVADSRKGLLKIRSGRLEASGVQGLPTERNIYDLRFLANGELWIGYHEGGIARVGPSGVVRLLYPKDGLAMGAVQAIYEDSGGTVWVGAEAGLSRFRGGRWTTWTKEHGLPGGSVHGIAEDKHGCLWLITTGGLVSLGREELDRSGDGSPQALHVSAFGPSDGIRLPRIRSIAGPRIARSRDGRLWISTNEGVASIDPVRLQRNAQPPVVAIERVSVDGTPVEATGGEVAFQGRSLQLEYTALSLTTSEGVKFRYKLEGYDRDWVSAGNTRQIVFVNLPPRLYRFHVTAANADGVWNSSGDTLVLRCLPFFYQTRLFTALSVAAIGLCACGIYWFRVWQLHSRYQLVLRERSRLTRELHDTLLQGFTGVVLQLEAASRQFEQSPELSKQRLDHALDQADQSLREARQAIVCMREPWLETDSLPEALSKLGKQILHDASIGFGVTVRGRVRHLHYQVQAALYGIAREAINNAINHARPSRIDLELAYSGDEVRLAVRDDGIGFDPQTATAKGNHFGLIGMRERAKQVSASFTLLSKPGQGTTIGVVVPERRNDRRSGEAGTER